MKRKVLLLSTLILLLLPACTPESSQMDEDTAMTVVSLQVTPALTHWLPVVASCANPIEDFGVATHIVSPEELDLEDTDLILRLGEYDEDDPFSAVMGTERLIVIVGKDVPLSSLSIETVQAIYTGLIHNWNEVPEIKSAGIEINQPIQPLSYPEGHELRHFFNTAYLNKGTISSEITVFSTLDALQTHLTSNPFSMAYLLESQVGADHQVLNITGFNSLFADIYVLAVTESEPSGKLRQLLLCLQNSQ